MKRLVVALILFAAVAAVWWFFLRTPSQPVMVDAPDPVEVVEPAPPTAPAIAAKPHGHGGVNGVPHVMPRPRPEPTWVQPGQSMPKNVVNKYPSMPPSRSAQEDVAQLSVVFGEFRRAFKENPVGGHLNIVEALFGANSKGLAYLDRSRHTFNQHGELLDRFGTPYFFHAESAKRMEIRSAGPDKIMYTDDDLTAY